MTFFRGHKSAFVADFVNFAKNNALKSVELLAPAKDFQSAVAAVDYGADAVYIGGAKFEPVMRQAIAPARSPVWWNMPIATECGCMPRSTR